MNQKGYLPTVSQLFSQCTAAFFVSFAVRLAGYTAHGFYVPHFVAK